MNDSTKLMENLGRVLSKGMASDLYLRKITLEAMDLLRCVCGVEVGLVGG